MGSTKHASFDGRALIVGFGSIGQGVLPLLQGSLGIPGDRIAIVNPGGDPTGIAAKYGVRVTDGEVTAQNHRELLGPLLAGGDFLLNLSVDVGSLDLIRLCRERGAMYIDTCNEPWPGRYANPRLSHSERSNYALREEALAWRRENPGGPTAVLTQGANPGLVSAFVKQALLQMAADLKLKVQTPAGSQGWAQLARRLGVRVMHVAERDTQVSARRKQKDEFVNTWSVVGLVDEGLQPAELGWGSHEKQLPPDGHRHGHGCGAAIYLDRPGMGTRVRSWTPLQGPYQGFLVTHAESITIADYFTLYDNGQVAYRPTVHYAYHPCDDAVLSVHELAGRNWQVQSRQRILRDEIDAGIDELGVLLMGNPRGVYWYGSRLSTAQAREIAPYNSATSLQVVAGILGGMVWALRHPDAGLVEPDEIDHRLMLEVAMPLLGEVVGVWGEWTPLQARNPLYAEDTDASDPWQFINFRVR